MIEKESNSNRGGKREGAGRKRGVKNKRTQEIESAAQKYATDALEALHHVATKGESEGARVSAATALLDRGWGKPRQAVEHTGEGGGAVEVKVTHQVVEPGGN
jgi:hypothetical protein